MKKVVVEENLDNITIVIKEPKIQEERAGWLGLSPVNSEPQLHAQLVFTDETWTTPPLQTADGSEPVTLVFRKIMNGDKRFWVSTGFQSTDGCGAFWFGDRPFSDLDDQSDTFETYRISTGTRACHEVEIEDEE